MSDVIPFSRFRADIAKTGAQRLKEILNSKDVTEAVEALDPLELFALAQDVGEAEAIDIVALATDEQVRRIIDLGIGSGDSPDLRYVERWLAAAIAHGVGSATRFFDKLDEDMQTLYLFRRLKIYDARDEEPPDDDVERLLTPDGHFILEVMEPPDETELDASLPAAANDSPQEQKPFSPLLFIADLYTFDWQRADTMVRDAKWAIASELEETIVRLRDARREELGFPPRDDAFKMFSRRPPAAKLVERHGHTSLRHTLPVTYAAPFFADSFFVTVMGRVQDETLLGELENELIYAVNAACVFEERIYSEPESVREAGRDVRNWISLGLELLSQGDVDAAAALLVKHPLREVLSVGVEESQKLGDWTRKAEASGLFRLPGLERRPFSGDEETFFKALIGRIPRLVATPGETPRAFASRQELAAATKKLELIARQIALVRFMFGKDFPIEKALEGCEPDAHAVTYEMLLRSSFVRMHIGASLQDTLGVSQADLRAFHDSTTPPSRRLVPELEAVFDTTFKQLRADVLAAGRDAEPQFLGLISRKEHA